MNETPRNVLGVLSEKGQSPIVVVAGLAGAMLLITIGWRLGNAVERPSTNSLSFERPSTQEVLAARPQIDSSRNWQQELAALGLIGTSTDGTIVATTTRSIGEMISEDFITGYLALKESGRYTAETAAQVGRSIGENVRAPSQFIVHSESELKKDSDSSTARALSYRADMREALTVLISDAPPEFETFALYIETKNPERLRELEEAADRYQKAESALLSVVVPQEAAQLHLRVINSLGSYADSLRQLIRYANEPLSTIAVLRTYNDAEREMLYAFDALASYYVRKSGE